MRRIIILYGIALAVLVFILKYIEYQWLVRDLAIEFYVGSIALLFTVIGVWMGLKLTRKNVIVNDSQSPLVDAVKIEQVGISKRELEVLQLMSAGLSNQEIADRLFVSLNTVKTHASNVFMKLEVTRRTQAIQKAKELRLI